MPGLEEPSVARTARNSCAASRFGRRSPPISLPPWRSTAQEQPARHRYRMGGLAAPGTTEPAGERRRCARGSTVHRATHAVLSGPLLRSRIGT